MSSEPDSDFVLLILSSPSGAGKTTLKTRILTESHPELRFSVSHTTRKPRTNEVDGREYHFVDRAAFLEMTRRDEFAEWAEVHGNLYGTSRGAIEERITGGHDVLLEIDWQGALQIKRLFPNAVLIFILPPSWDELRLRLERRGEDDAETIEQRMANARVEVSKADQFDFVIINALFESALFDLKAIVHSQRLKYASLQRAKPAVFAALDLL
jgi:guanylate kinase